MERHIGGYTREGAVSRRYLALCALISCVALLVSCTPKTATPTKPAKLRIGTIPVVDTLPLWVAEKDGLFKKAGLDVALYTFPSTQDRDQALTDGTISGTQGDLIEIASNRSKGVPLKATTIMLGETAKQGRSGLVAAPGSKITSLKQLAGVQIATSEGGIPEYVLDSLMAEAGVPESRVKKLVIKKVQVRQQLVISGRVAAAMMTEPSLTQALQQGARLLMDDTHGPNLSESVLIFRGDFLDKPEGKKAVLELLEVWNEAVARINANPNAYRQLLAEKASIPANVAKTFVISDYPEHQLPTRGDVDRLLAWMRMEHLLTRPVTYEDMVWTSSGR